MIIDRATHPPASPRSTSTTRQFASWSCRLLVVVCLAGVASPRSPQGDFAEPPSAPVERLIRNVQAHLADHPDDADTQAVEKGLAIVKAIPGGAMTPIIFPLDAPRPLHALLSDRAATFDLDGDLHSERWSWVRPDTAILVWDPAATGTITSGRQLFGSVSWWMFWTDGYHALDALDDDRDGELRGAELAGLAVWRDATGNGVSEPGEVVPLATVGITGLATRATTTAEGCPAHPQGVRLRDGRLLPSYDWIAEPR